MLLAVTSETSPVTTVSSSLCSTVDLGMWPVALGVRLLALLLVAGPGGRRGPAAAAALGLPAAPVDQSADHLEPSTASAQELTVEHTEIASGLVVEPAHAPASKAVHKVVLLDAEPEMQQIPPLVDQARSPTGSEPTRYRRVTRRAYLGPPRAYPGRATTRAPRYS